MAVVKSIQELDKLQSMKAAQKAKIKWAIEGDENSKYYHGILKKGINSPSEVLTWIDNPVLVKNEFLSHFRNRFERPKEARLNLNMEFLRKLTSMQQSDLEIDVSNDEIKRAVWDCGVDKSPGPDVFTFGFYRHFWKLIENDVVAAVKYFFQIGSIPKGCNSSIIALISKIIDAKMVKDFRPISLIGCLYKIIAKILANRLVVVLGDIVNEVQSAFVADKHILDRPFILNELFHWCKSKKKHSFIFKVEFEKAYDSSDSNIDTIVHVLECFHRASGLRINMSKSKLMGIAMDVDRVEQAALKIGCAILKASFSYLGLKVGVARLLKWKMKTLSISGRLTLLKSVLGSIPIYHMSIFKVPMKVLHRMEPIRSHLFNGMDLGSKKSIWVKWNNVLASKEKGGLGVSSLYALNRARMFKWIWRFTTHKSSLWARVIKAIHGDGGFQDARFPRLYALESHKRIDVAAKLAHSSVVYSFRRAPRSGEEQSQLADLLTTIEGVSLVSMNDRWVWSLEGSGNFFVASVRELIDDRRLPDVSSKTRWIKAVPIKVNVHAWKVRLDSLPTRLNNFRRGMDITSIFCLICGNAVESSRHLFFDCHVAKDLFRKISRWWDLSYMEMSSYDEWLAWILNLRLSVKHRRLLEGM
nr:RNA-directed DNA polymerase, eukaryota, reverse transcriptase zinc-binding domain protein [Tanacetum cinerariifolium]